MSHATNRFVPEEPAALAAYLAIALRVLDGPISAAVDPEHGKALSDLREVQTVLERVRWHILADVGAPSSGTVAQDEAAFADQQQALPPAAPRAQVDIAALQAILRAKLPGAENLVVDSLRIVPGGRSKLTALLTQSRCATLPSDLVLRQDWASAVTGTSVAAEFELLTILSSSGVLAPRCFFYEREGSALGGAFILVSRFAGYPRGDIFQPPASPTLALQLATQLGRLHGLSSAKFRSIASLTTRDADAGELAARLAELAAVNRSLGQPVSGVEQAFHWLETQVATLRPAPEVLVHGDIGWHNLLVDGDQLTALLDWELAHFGNPAEDLGYIKGDIERMLPWPEFMEAYRAAGGSCRSEEDIDFYFVWGLVRLYVLLVQARAGLKGGLVQDVAVARVCIDSMPRLVAVLTDGLRAILDRSKAAPSVRHAAA